MTSRKLPPSELVELSKELTYKESTELLGKLVTDIKARFGAEGLVVLKRQKYTYICTDYFSPARNSKEFWAVVESLQRRDLEIE